MFGEVGAFSAFSKSDPIKPWFEAVEATGDSVMIRFGRLGPGSSEVEWMTMSHAEFDGIGGFSDYLRRRGVEMSELPKNENLQKPSWLPFLKALPKHFAFRRKLKWKNFGEEKKSESEVSEPVTAWHVFSGEETVALRARSRENGVTLNSLLLQGLDGAIRKDLVEEDIEVPWMIPVNLRGQIERDRDTQNHTSYVSVKVKSGEKVQDLHREIYRKLSAGEYWANWKAYRATRLVPAFVKRLLVRSGRATTEWNVGVFSNLGAWDPDRKIENEDLQGGWLFGAPVLRFQTVSAGAITFQGKLGLMIQAHPDLTSSEEVVSNWMGDWIRKIYE